VYAVRRTQTPVALVAIDAAASNALLRTDLILMKGES
jgi:hypothetical protein